MGMQPFEGKSQNAAARLFRFRPEDVDVTSKNTHKFGASVSGKLFFMGADIFEADSFDKFEGRAKSNDSGNIGSARESNNPGLFGNQGHEAFPIDFSVGL